MRGCPGGAEKGRKRIITIEGTAGIKYTQEGKKENKQRLK